MNLIEECVRRDVARQVAEYGEDVAGPADARRWIAPVVADVLDILTAEGRISPPVPPGPCWHDSGVTWPGETASVRCELLAGHDGAHQADRGSRGGTAVWTETTPPTAHTGDLITPPPPGDDGGARGGGA